MKSIQELADNTKLPISKIKAQAVNMFGTAKDLSPEQIAELAEKLRDASEIAALPPAQREAEVLSIKQLNQDMGDEIEKTFKVIGITNLKKTRTLLDSIVRQQMIESKSMVDQATDFMEGYMTNKLTDTYTRMAKNLHAINQEFNCKSFSDSIRQIESGEVTQINLDDIDLDLLQFELDL